MASKTERSNERARYPKMRWRRTHTFSIFSSHSLFRILLDHNVTTVARVRSWVIIIILMMKLIKKYGKAQSYTDGTLFGVTQWYKIEKKWSKNEYFNNDIVCLFLKNHWLLLFNKIKILRNNSFSQTPRNN